MLYFLAYLAGCASVGALWYFWPQVTAEEVKIQTAAKAQVDKLKSKL